MRPKPLPEKAVLLGTSLVVADLHVGYEMAMIEEGFSLPRRTEEIIASLRRLGEGYSVSTLIVAGDLKHSFQPLKNERRELNFFIGEIKEIFGEIILVRGNHDVGVSWLKSLGVEIVDEIETDGWKIVHGHKPAEGRRLILGHEHPTLTLTDEVGARLKVPAFLIGRRTVVLPAFNPWASGNDVLQGFISPVLREREEKLEMWVPAEGELLNFGSHSKLRSVLKALKGGE